MRKYESGEYITSLDELNRSELIYCNGKILHRGWFQSWPLRLANLYIGNRSLRYAVPRLNKECNEDEFLNMLRGDATAD